MIVNIICGSPEILLEKEVFLEKGGYNIGVDRGAIHLLEIGIIPDFAIGDFDSISTSELNRLQDVCEKVVVLKAEKDETDTEMAVRYGIDLNPSEIRLYGAIGGRLDHTFANFRLLATIQNSEIKASIRDCKNVMYLLSPGTHEFNAPLYKYLSFFANQGDVEGLTLKGVKYPLVQYDLKFNDIKCISNEVIADKFEVIFKKGLLLMINSTD